MPSPQPPALPSFLAIERPFWAARWRDVLIACWRATPDVAVSRRQIQACTRNIKDTARPCTLLIILEPQVGLPDNDTRKVLTEGTQGYGPNLQRISTVVEGQGFAASAVRAVLTGMTMVLRGAYPTRIVGSVAEVAPWLAEPLPGHDPAELVAVVAALRARAAAQP